MTTDEQTFCAPDAPHLKATVWTRLHITPIGVTLYGVMAAHENPFVFGEIIDDANFVDRTDELNNLVSSFSRPGALARVPSSLSLSSN